MAISVMYPAKAGSPKTTLTAALTAADTSMTLTSAAVLPDATAAAPCLAVIGSDSDAEVVSYTGKTGNTVTGLVRGLGGTVASAWVSGTDVARNYTSLDHTRFIENIQDLDSARIPTGGAANAVLRKSAAGNYQTEWHALGALAEKDSVDLTADVASTVLPLANGGTGASTASGARDALGLGDLAVKDSVDLTADVTSTVLPLANGGTGASTASGARDALGLGDLAVKDSVDLTADVTSTVLPVANGGTGASTASGARDALGLGDLAVKDSVDLTADVASTVLPLANGGTGASTASGARTALGGICAKPDYEYDTTDLTAGTSSLDTGKLYFYYEAE